MKEHERLEKAIDYLKNLNPNLTDNDIMRRLGFRSSGGYLSDMQAGRKPVSDKFLKRLEQEFGIYGKWIRTGKGEMINQEIIKTLTRKFLLPTSEADEINFRRMILEKLAHLEHKIDPKKPYEFYLQELMKEVAKWSSA